MGRGREGGERRGRERGRCLSADEGALCAHVWVGGWVGKKNFGREGEGAGRTRKVLYCAHFEGRFREREREREELIDNQQVTGERESERVREIK